MSAWPKFSPLFLSLLAVGSMSHADLVPLSEESLAESTGEGIAIVLDDIRLTVAPTSYYELTGTNPPVGNPFRRVDTRYYGLSLTPGGTAATNYDGTACAANDVRCPLGVGTFNLAPHDNPYLLRVFDYSKIEYDGVTRNRTVLELLGPTNMDKWRFALWGELEIGQNAAGTPCDGDTGTAGVQPCFFQSQMVILGKPVTKDGKGSVLRMVTSSNAADPTFGIIYDSHLSGDFRFSVNKTSNVESIGNIPAFSVNEGVFFKNADALVPLGQMHYQTIIFDDAQPGASGGTPLLAGDADTLGGNFKMELSQIPNVANVYNDFYSAPATCGTYAASECGYQRTGRPARYNETHGYVRFGQSGTLNDSGTQAQKTADTTDGIYFTGVSAFRPYASQPDDTVINDTPPTLDGNYPIANITTANLGDSTLNGLLVHHLYIKTLGAN